MSPPRETVVRRAHTPHLVVRAYHYDGSAYRTIGYAFANGDLGTGVPVAGSAIGKGVVLSGGLDSWGTGGPLGYQALGSYNFGSKSFWGRGRVTTRVSQNGPSQMR